MTMIPDGALDQFNNTFKEWHYFVGGFSIGFTIGVGYGLSWALAYEEVQDD